MLDIMYEIPKDDSIGEVIITKEYIEHTGWSEDPFKRTGAAVVAVKRIQMGFYIQGGMTYERRFIWQH